MAVILKTEDIRPEELLVYNHEYQVIICQQCKYALRGTAIDRHLKEIHKILRSSRHPYMAYVSQFDLAEPNQVAKQPLKEFPVSFLPVFDGLKCLAIGCSYLCISLKRMQKHWLSAHERHGFNDTDWQPALLQTFFRGNSLRYFTGNLKGLDLGQKQPVTHHSLPEPTIYQRVSTGPLAPSKEELLRNFQSSTFRTIVNGEEDVWRHVVPQIATSHQFLMHAILACSALHLAAEHPLQQQYLYCAYSHQGIAMSMFREAVTVVAEDNCHAILAFMHLLVVYSFGAERHDESLLLTDPSSPEPDFLPSWLYFRRNGCIILGDYKDLVESGPLQQLCQCWHRPGPLIEPFLKTTDPLLMLLKDLTATLDNVVEFSKEDCHVLESSGRQLGSTIVGADTLRYDFSLWDAVCGWPMMVSMDYTNLLTQQNPVALILLGYYCLFLKKLQRHWFIGNYPLQLLYRIKGRLESRWHIYINSLISKWEEGL